MGGCKFVRGNHYLTAFSAIGGEIAVKETFASANDGIASIRMTVFIVGHKPYFTQLNVEAKSRPSKTVPLAQNIYTLANDPLGLKTHK